MERLEEIVRLLEKGEAPLNESMKLFEEGTKLSAALGITPEQVPGYIAAEVAQAGCGAET